MEFDKSKKTFLCDLAKKHNTDKFNHGYTQFYDYLFKDLRHNVKNILEVGVQHGRSIKMWREYFPNATIFAIDFQENALKNVREIENCIPLLIDVSRKNEIKEKILDTYPNVQFDIVIDDASHLAYQQSIVFFSLFPRMMAQGFYIVEDLQHQNFLEGKHAFIDCLTTIASRQAANNHRDLIISFYNQLAIIKTLTEGSKINIS